MRLTRTLVFIWAIFSLVLLFASSAYSDESRLQYWLSLIAPIGFFALSVVAAWLDDLGRRDN